MIADVDYDIFSHLGFVQNIDLDQKGVYVIQVSLYCGDNGIKIAPVGLFSAPNGLESFVEEHKLSSAVLSTTCEIVDHKKLFRSRSFVVRYKSEIHELNEGVHWRLTLPNVDLTNQTTPSPVCKELLQLKFELMFCELLTKADVDLQNDIDKLIPDNPIFVTVATQDLIIQRAGTGLHEYYPIRFSDSRYINLDCMIHCAVTGIRFKKISLSVIPQRTSEAIVGESPLVSEKEAVAQTSDLESNKGSDNPPLDSVKTAESITGSTTGPGVGGESEATPASVYSGPASPYSTVVGLRADNDSPVPGVTQASSTANNRRTSLTAIAWRRVSGFGSAPPTETPESVAVVSPVAENAIKKLKDTLHLSVRQNRNAATSDKEGSVSSSTSGGSANTSHKSVLEHLHGIINTTSSMIQGIDVSEVILKEKSLTKSDCGLLEYEIELLVNAYAAVYERTFNELLKSSREFLTARPDLHWQVESEYGPTSHSEEGAINRDLDAAKCLFEMNKTSVCSDLMHVPTLSFVCDVIQDQTTLCNSQLHLHWSTLMSGLKKSMRGNMVGMKANYEKRMREYWGLQVLVHTKSIFDTHRLLPAEEMTLLNIFNDRMKCEVEESVSMIQLIDSNVPVAVPVLARGLRVFDANVHANPTKIPFLVLQQYVGDIQKDSSELGAPASPLSEGHEILSGGVFDTSLRLGSVHLCFGGRLLHCSSAGSSGREITVDIFPLVSLAPLFKDQSQGIQYLQLQQEKFDRAAKRAGSHEMDVTQADLDHAEKELTSFSKKVEAILNAKSTSEVNHVIGKMGEEDLTSSSNKVAAILNAKSTSEVNHVIGKMGGIDISRARAGGSNWKEGLGKHRSSTIQASKKAPAVATPNRKSHLIVLQHGFLGTSYDMRYIENAIRLELSSNIQVFIPKSNDEHSQDSIAQMSKRLAFELLQYCKEKMPSLLDPFSDTKISFIGHSMGGLIVRLALQESTLKPLMSKLYTFLSLSTPHLGTLFSDSQLVATGMWAMFKFKKCRSLKELVLDDGIGGKLKKTLLYKMSLNGVLSLFHKVILVSSPKDQYVPTYSARIQISRKIESDETVGATIAAMTANILSQLRADQLIRVTLDNNIGEATSTNSVNAMIGRTAHICYLENQQIAVQVIAALRPYFE